MILIINRPDVFLQILDIDIFQWRRNYHPNTLLTQCQEFLTEKEKISHLPILNRRHAFSLLTIILKMILYRDIQLIRVYNQLTRHSIYFPSKDFNT